MSSYPVLSYEDAVTTCRDLFNVTISEEGLRRPTSQFVKKLYLDIVTASMNISSDQMIQPPFKFLSNFHNPEIAEEGSSFMFFTIFLQRYMHVCTVQDFSKNDLSNPKPKRTLSCISAIINYEKFKRSQEHHFETAFEEKETLLEQKTLMVKKNQELKEKIAKIKMARNEDEEKIQQIVPIVDNLKRAVNELNKQQASDFKETQQLKTEIAERASKEAELKVLIANNNEECEKMKGQVVTSPEKFLGEVRRIDDAIKACKESIAEKGKKLIEKRSQEESINFLEQKCTQAVKLISSLEEETEKLRNLQDKLLDLHDIVTTDDGAIVQKNLQYKNAKRQLASLNEKLDRLQRTNEKKFSAKNDEFEQRKKNVQSLEQNRRNCQEQIIQIKTEFEEVVKTLNELEDDHTSKMDTMENSYQELITSINNYHGMLEDGCKSLLSTLGGSEQ